MRTASPHPPAPENLPQDTPDEHRFDDWGLGSDDGSEETPRPSPPPVDMTGQGQQQQHHPFHTRRARRSRSRSPLGVEGGYRLRAPRVYKERTRAAFHTPSDASSDTLQALDNNHDVHGGGSGHETPSPPTFREELDRMQLTFDAHLAGRLQQQEETHLASLSRVSEELARQLEQEEQTSHDETLGQTSRDEPPIHATCTACGDILPLSTLPALAACTHRPKTCSTCLTGWVNARLEDTAWRGARCPVDTCRRMLTYDELKMWASSDAFERFDAGAARAAVGALPGFRWCRAEGCGSGQVDERGGGQWVCVGCGCVEGGD